MKLGPAVSTIDGEVSGRYMIRNMSASGWRDCTILDVTERGLRFGIASTDPRLFSGQKAAIEFVRSNHTGQGLLALGEVTSTDRGAIGWNAWMEFAGTSSFDRTCGTSRWRKVDINVEDIDAIIERASDQQMSRLLMAAYLDDLLPSLNGMQSS
jgi:hypothetical protein